MSNGCTLGQLQSRFGQSCGRQTNQDVGQSKPYAHYMFCNGGEMKCCTVSNTTGAVLNCRRPAGAGLVQGKQGLSNPGSILSRGVEGADETDEATEIPPWLTESWRKDHPSKDQPK